MAIAFPGVVMFWFLGWVCERSGQVALGHFWYWWAGGVAIMGIFIEKVSK